MKVELVKRINEEYNRIAEALKDLGYFTINIGMPKIPGCGAAPDIHIWAREWCDGDSLPNL
jgi:hypothetical protein